MVQVPAFILKRLYVRGSLRPTETGFAFDVENQLGAGYAREMLPVTLDGAAQPLTQSFFRRPDGVQIAFSDVSEAVPFTLEMGGQLTILVEGAMVTPGKHKVGMGFVVRGIGPLSFEASDIVE
jgi:hypothetical protein